MSLIMDLIGLELLKFSALELENLSLNLGKLLNLTFVYTLASTNINQSAKKLSLVNFLVNTSIDKC